MVATECIALTATRTHELAPLGDVSRLLTGRGVYGRPLSVSIPSVVPAPLVEFPTPPHIRPARHVARRDRLRVATSQRACGRRRIALASGRPSVARGPLAPEFVTIWR